MINPRDNLDVNFSLAQHFLKTTKLTVVFYFFFFFFFSNSNVFIGHFLTLLKKINKKNLQLKS